MWKYNKNPLSLGKIGVFFWKAPETFLSALPGFHYPGHSGRSLYSLSHDPVPPDYISHNCSLHAESVFRAVNPGPAVADGCEVVASTVLLVSLSVPWLSQFSGLIVSFHLADTPATFPKAFWYSSSCFPLYIYKTWWICSCSATCFWK